MRCHSVHIFFRTIVHRPSKVCLRFHLSLQYISDALLCTCSIMKPHVMNEDDGPLSCIHILKILSWDGNLCTVLL